MIHILTSLRFAFLLREGWPRQINKYCSVHFCLLPQQQLSHICQTSYPL
jgi:hypothetical protein